MDISFSDPTITLFISDIVGEGNHTEFLLDFMGEGNCLRSFSQIFCDYLMSGLESVYGGAVEEVNWSAYGAFQLTLEVNKDLIAEESPIRYTIKSIIEDFTKEYRVAELYQLFNKANNIPEVYLGGDTWYKRNQYLRVIDLLAKRVLRETPMGVY